MRIAIFHELAFGGAKRTVSEFTKRLSKIFEVDLYYVDSKKDENFKDFIENAFFYPFYPKPWVGKNWIVRLYKDTIELASLYNLHKKIAYGINSGNYDYIFVHPSKFTQAPFLLRFIKKRCIYYCQEPLRIVYDPFLSDISRINFPKKAYEFVIRKIRKWIDKANLANADLILANSKFSKEFIYRSYGKKAVVCYLGVAADFFKPMGIDKTIDVLFIGNRDSGYDLLNKFSRAENKLKLHAIFRENGESSISDGELVEIYNKSKVLVVLNRNEPFGLIPLEAMACGTPVIAVNEGGYKETIINNKTGFLIKRDQEQLYEKINTIINDDNLRTKMSKMAREHVLQNWTWNKSIERFLEIINYAK